MIDIVNVTKHYGSIQALRDVSFHAPRGSILGLLGQNGAGKTTLLNIITGYLAPSSGHVLLGGYDPLMQPAMAKRHLGYLPEHPPLYDEMTVCEYLSFVAELRGVKKHAISAHVSEIMELTGLLDMRSRLLSNLSKGYRQRAGIAQTLCGDPDVLVLDEPTVGLDPKQITEIRNLIKTLSKDRTIIFSSHILSEIQQLCNHVVILHNGSVKLDVPMSDVYDSREMTLLCTLGTAQTQIAQKLRELEGIRRVTPQSSARPNESAYTLTFYDEPDPERKLFALLSGLDIPILHLSRCEDTLEQVFLRVVSE
ncbi:MAG: ABC transporter ATP-binding protein [Clostridiales bacterium]|nr:ABC transporter ATP-binding protein [Clostridiales bacterium]